MRVIIKMDFSDAEREIIAAELDSLEDKKITGRKATRAELREYVFGGFELRFCDSRCEFERLSTRD